MINQDYLIGKYWALRNALYTLSEQFCSYSNNIPNDISSDVCLEFEKIVLAEKVEKEFIIIAKVIVKSPFGFASTVRRIPLKSITSVDNVLDRELEPMRRMYVHYEKLCTEINNKYLNAQVIDENSNVTEVISIKYDRMTPCMYDSTGTLIKLEEYKLYDSSSLS